MKTSPRLSHRPARAEAPVPAAAPVARDPRAYPCSPPRIAGAARPVFEVSFEPIEPEETPSPAIQAPPESSEGEALPAKPLAATAPAAAPVAAPPELSQPVPDAPAAPARPWKAAPPVVLPAPPECSLEPIEPSVRILPARPGSKRLSPAQRAALRPANP